MVVGIVRAELHVPMAASLKDERTAVKGLKEQLRAHFNVSVAELDVNDTWQRATVGVAAVGDDEHDVAGRLKQVEDWIRRNHLVAVVRLEQEWCDVWDA